MVAKCAPSRRGVSLADAVVETFAGLSLGLSKNHTPPIVNNPSLVEEDLARDWKQVDYNYFREKLSDAMGLSTLVQSAKPREARAIWRDLFGPAVPE
jgi:hypothetical protein